MNSYLDHGKKWCSLAVQDLQTVLSIFFSLYRTTIICQKATEGIQLSHEHNRRWNATQKSTPKCYISVESTDYASHYHSVHIITIHLYYSKLLKSTAGRKETIKNCFGTTHIAVKKKHNEVIEHCQVQCNLVVTIKVKRIWLKASFRSH